MPTLTLLIIVATFAAVMFVTLRDVDRGLAATVTATLSGVAAATATLVSFDALALLGAVSGAFFVQHLLRRARGPAKIYIVPGMTGAQRIGRIHRTAREERFVVISGGRSKIAR